MKANHHGATSWSQCPCATNGEPIWVDCRFNLCRVAGIDTVTETAFVDVYVVFFWNDSRLLAAADDDNHHDSDQLPPKLWGPCLQLDNALEIEEIQVLSNLEDSSTGRMKRALQYKGTVDNPMHLRDFPFDVDNVQVSFSTRGHWLTCDGQLRGASCRKLTYRLRKVQETGEGRWLVPYWDGRLSEWSLHGVSTGITEMPAAASGSVPSFVVLNFHVSRQAGYYFWKALFPLYLLMVLSFSTFQFETDNLSDRISTVATFFLAAFAMLYVVGAAIPKTDYLTKIDSVIILTTGSLAFMGVASQVLEIVHRDNGKSTADACNLLLWIGLATLYIVANFLIFVPAWLRQRRAVATMHEQKLDVGHEYTSWIALTKLPQSSLNGTNNPVSRSLIK